VTQWRTTPAVADLNADGLNDLVMLDHEGWLCFWPREKQGEQLIVKPGQRVLCDEKGEPLRLNPGSGGRSGRRKLHLADWDGDDKLDLLLNGTNAEFWRQIDFKDGIWKFQRVSDVSSTKIDAHDTSPTTVDFDADGNRDLVIGAEDGRFYFLHSLTSVATSKPEFPGKRSEWNGFDRCDFKSWPGGKGKGKGSPRDWKLVIEQYGFANEQEAMDYKGNPIDSLEPLAKAGVPLLHVYGDADDVVPSDENTGIVAE